MTYGYASIGITCFGQAELIGPTLIGHDGVVSRQRQGMPVAKGHGERIVGGFAEGGGKVLQHRVWTSTAPLINTLVSIAHSHHIRTRPSKHGQQPLLNRIDILVLINNHMIQETFDPLAERGFRFQGLQRAVE